MPSAKGMVIHMLESLHIENIAVIESADLELGDGFNVLTGETGAGKSILIDSINLVLGERVSRDIIRSGAEAGHVSAVFRGISAPARESLRSLGYEYDGELLIQRDISADGRGACRISGRPATVSIVRSVGRLLVNIHGQHENQALLSTERHLHYLDEFAENGGAFSAYGEAYRAYRDAQSALSSVRMDEAEKARRTDLLRYQIDEIEAAQLAPGEEEDLRARKLRLDNAEKIASAASEARAMLSGGEDSSGAQELLSRAGDALEGLSSVLPEMQGLSERLRNLAYETEDCAEELRGYLDDGEYDPRELERIEERMDLIFRLGRKYGGSVEEILEYRKRSHAELGQIEHAEEREAELSKRLKEAKKELFARGGVLSARRKKAAEEMSARIREELAFLNMPGVAFCVQFEDLPEPGPNGLEEAEFLISPNPGSPARPLAKIASGGEISRVMLAIKTVLARGDDIDTLIFDEIDTGVSGGAAQRIGEKLRQVSKDRQVVCVTHLAQIASQADRHVLIEKQIENGKTYTRLRMLDTRGREQELARIIAGTDITEKTLQTAAEMLSLAQKRKA